MGVLCSHLGSEWELVLLLEHLGQGQRRHRGLSLNLPCLPAVLSCVYPAWVALPPLKVSLSLSHSSSTAGRSLGLSDGRSGLRRRSSKVRLQGQLLMVLPGQGAAFYNPPLLSHIQTQHFSFPSPQGKSPGPSSRTARGVSHCLWRTQSPVPVPRLCWTPWSKHNLELRFVGSDRFLNLYF